MTILLSPSLSYLYTAKYLFLEFLKSYGFCGFDGIAQFYHLKKRQIFEIALGQLFNKIRDYV